jgi:hypothetical protein
MELETHVQEQVDNIRRTEDVSKKSLQVASETADLMIELNEKRDPTTVEADFSSRFQDIKDRALEGVNDYKVATALTSHLGEKEVEHAVKTKGLSWKWTVENGQEAVQTDTDTIISSHTTSLDVANPDPVMFANTADKIHERIDAAVAASLITPEAGRKLYEEKKKDLYVQAAYRAMMDDPQGAPVKVMAMLLPSGLDPKLIEEIHRTAIIRRESSESLNHKGDEIRWEKAAAPMDFEAREGRLGAKEVLESYQAGTIGPTQYYRLQGVVQSHGIKSNEASQDLMYSVLNRMYTGELTPDKAANVIQGLAANITPAHQAHAYQTIRAIGGAVDKIPATMSRAERLIATMVYPSLGTPSPKSDEGKKYGKMMGELYGEYFANKEKYQKDPDGLIKWAQARIAPKDSGDQGSIRNAPGGNPYSDALVLRKAYKFYVTDGNKNKNGVTPRNYWKAWFDQLGETMPAWPEGR